MNKIDIIERVAFCMVPQGARLTEVSIPQNPGIKVAHIGPQDDGSIYIVLAEITRDTLRASTAEYGDAPIPDLLRSIHEACVRMTESSIRDAVFDEVISDMIAFHRLMVGEIQKISAELTLPYEQPRDQFLT